MSSDAKAPSGCRTRAPPTVLGRCGLGANERKMSVMARGLWWNVAHVETLRGTTERGVPSTPRAVDAAMRLCLALELGENLLRNRLTWGGCVYDSDREEC
jgi:hypothetical protein